ncbi:YqgE/AlgH family protein [Novipirellula artificiosorum]|uniref:Uncharacterized protein n=1 Tax=Novipirellula artificiosorum TaxID=2528016 RepID=A0A5C6DCT8_9BACT|nr:YqgE/AlgH family protein [Novipirellula artificiosorum]TWU34508.1 hypothetical protein Poly41_46560 [Novipirellula artificiosorum]
MTENLTGNLLVASTLVADPILSRGVCLLVHDDEDAVIGIMLNRPMQPNPKALIAMLNQLQEDSTDEKDPTEEGGSAVEARSKATPNPRLGERNSSDPSSMIAAGAKYSPSGMVHFGGPLSGPIVAIHQLSQYAEAETGQGIYVAAQKQHLEDLVKQQPGPYRLIVGHLGWEPEQLSAEMDAGLWHVVPATAEIVFENSEQMWPRLIRRATSHSLARWIGVKDPGHHAEWN